jgi:hypothetical protein
MKSILECKEIEKEYLLFSISATQYIERINELTSIWIMGVEEQFEKAIEVPSQDYIDNYAESEDELYRIYFQKEGFEEHKLFGECFDLRSFSDMKKLRNLLFSLK